MSSSRILCWRNCFASSAIRLCLVDTILELQCIRRVSQKRFVDSMPRFPPLESTGCRCPTSRVLSRHCDFLTPLPLRFVAFARRYHDLHSVRSGMSSAVMPAWSWSSGTPPALVVETTGSPKFLENPYDPFAHVLRLRQDCWPQTISRLQHGPR